MPGTTKTKEQLPPIVSDPTALTDAQRRAFDAYRKAAVSFPKVVKSLVDLLGAQLTAYIGGVRETRAVREWIEGEREPNAATQSKLRITLQIALELSFEGEDGVIAAWFQGFNPGLDDQQPAKLIREAGETELSETGKRLLLAAREFTNI
jgi:hypothetical protein